MLYVKSVVSVDNFMKMEIGARVIGADKKMMW